MTKNEIIKIYIRVLRIKKNSLRQRELEENGVSTWEIDKNFGSLKKLEEAIFKSHPKLFPKNHEVGKRGKNAEDVYDAYIKVRKELGRQPLVTEFFNLGNCDENHLYEFFGSIDKLESQAREKNPEIFNDVSVNIFKDKKKVKLAERAIKNSKRFFVTTIVTGCSIDENLYKSIENWCKKNDGEILILIAEDPAKQKDKAGEYYADSSLVDSDGHIIVKDTALNSNIHLSTIKLSAKQIEATTGLDRLSKVGTFVYASPKQRLKPIPVGNTKLTHLLVTTGSLSLPEYKSEMYMSLRLAYIAEFDHVMGGLIVEIEDDSRYHIRHVQSNGKGEFIDLGTMYKPNGTTSKENALSIWPGDWHTGSTDPMVKACIKDMCSVLKPDHLFLNDFFDGLSINHHIEKDRIELALLSEKGKLNLEHELIQLKDELLELTSWDAKHLNIVYSNHDDFLNRYLRAATYAETTQSQNHRISLKLALAALDGLNPLEYAVNELLKFNKKDKVTWLKLDQDLILAGIQHGSHGHLGSNGSHNPSCMGLERAYGTGNFGHSHSGEILRNVWRAGTSTHLKLGYNKGASSWNTATIISYKNGSRQMIFPIDWKWHLDSKVKK